MVDYEPRQYTGQMWYTPKNNVSQMDTRIKLYQPLKPIKDLPKPRTYDTEPPRYAKTRVYEKSTMYDSYAEYVPPSSLYCMLLYLSSGKYLLNNNNNNKNQPTNQSTNKHNKHTRKKKKRLFRTAKRCLCGRKLLLV